MKIREQLALRLNYGRAADAGLRDAAASENKSLPIHRWVPWIAGFSAQFVEDAIRTYLPKSSRREYLILDPFAGVGTTLVEAVKAGHHTAGYEINAFAVLATSAKLRCLEVRAQDFRAEVEAFRSALQRFEATVDRRWAEAGDEGLAGLGVDLLHTRPSGFKSRIPFFSRPIEIKFLYALARAKTLLDPDRILFRAALGATMVSFSNYTYEPSLASRPGSGKPLIENASVVMPVCKKLDEMLTDIEWARQNYERNWLTLRREVVHGSYFDSTLAPGSVSLVITSPPYMNNYHYVRNTRPQLHWLELVQDGEVRQLEQSSFGKFWQTVRQGEEVALEFENAPLSAILDRLRSTNTDKGYYGGSGWANYVATYLNDSHRFIGALKSHLRPGGYAVIVVGNSIIQGMEFAVDRLMAEMAERQGLMVEEICIVRKKRVGTSIIDSSVRNGAEDGHRGQTQLYDAAVVVRK